MEQVNTPASYSLAKALHYTHFSIQYLQDAIRQKELTGNAKQFVNDLINKQQWVIKTVYARMTPAGADLLRKEIEGRDIAAIDSIINLVIALPEADRLAVENFATVLSKNVKTHNDETNTDAL